MVVVHPVPQAEKDQLANDRMVAVDRVAAAGVVLVGRATVAEHVVDAVFQPLEGERGAEVVALSGVVEDHVENHLDPGGVQRPHHLLELPNLAAWLGAGRVTPMGREKGDRIVAPVVAANRAVGPRQRGREVVNGHQLDGGHTQRLEVGNLLDDPEIGAGMGNAARRAVGEAPDMHLVDHGVGEAAAEVTVALPVEGIIDDDAFRGPQQTVRPDRKLTSERPSIGIEEPGGAVKPLAVLRIERAVGLEMVELTRLHARHIDAPNVSPAIAGRVEFDHLVGLGGVDTRVEEHTHGRRRAAVHHELHPLVVQHGAVGQRLAELQGRQQLLGVGASGRDRLPRRHGKNDTTPTRLPYRRSPRRRGGRVGGLRHPCRRR